MAYKNKILIIYLTAFFIDLVNLFIASVAFPHIGKDLQANISQMAWIANIYSLGLALILPASSWLSDKFGTKHVFIFALMGTFVSILMCGFSSSIYQLIFWRLLQGLTGGLLIPVGQTITYKEFPPAERAKLSMKILTIASIAPAISPSIGGFIVDSLNWRWVFFINLPLLAFIILLAFFWIKHDEKGVEHSFDWFGMLLVSSSLFLILIGLSEFKSLADLKLSLFWTFIGIVLFLIFIFYARNKKGALLDLSILKNKLFISGMIFYLFVPGVFTGIGIINIFLFQSVLGFSATKTGFLMLPFAIGNFIAVVGSGNIFNRIGPKPIALIALSIWCLGMFSLLMISNQNHYNMALCSYFVMGIGSGSTSYLAQTMAMLTIPREKISKASALWNLNRQLSFSFGVTIFAMIFQMLLNAHGIFYTEHFTYSPQVLSVFYACFNIAGFLVVIPIAMILMVNNKEVLNQIKTHHP